MSAVSGTVPDVVSVFVSPLRRLVSCGVRGVLFIRVFSLTGTVEGGIAAFVNPGSFDGSGGGGRSGCSSGRFSSGVTLIFFLMLPVKK